MKKVATVIALVVALGIGVVGSALAGLDFGLDTQNLLKSKSQPLFGVGKALDASSQDSISQATADADPTALVTLANELIANVVTSGVAAPNIDMMALWPDDEAPSGSSPATRRDPVSRASRGSRSRPVRSRRSSSPGSSVVAPLTGPRGARSCSRRRMGRAVASSS